LQKKIWPFQNEVFKAVFGMSPAFAWVQLFRVVVPNYRISDSAEEKNVGKIFRHCYRKPHSQGLANKLNNCPCPGGVAYWSSRPPTE
jgi:hypothetical protein